MATKSSCMQTAPPGSNLTSVDQLLGHIKPAQENYTKALEMIKREPEECVLAAAHAYDTRSAKKAG
ncbi:hypothetical protein CLAFUW4_13132 [Fulvia fulva]|uniref:Uncharacterized protein n=1 Tax=Passalora fulva TaxID=5499 RepID=A0A9Q8UUW4_PASFU|nr:uncharacterized protein CLAFUR5_12991 [Fulvia fulva]KAK4611568.1 hypothetical protein CLAFUR4_13137 [Fulvia fulva]KAK4613020.1 hypothetical protein CLAFUR0_13141 [Fulvia fulva]UJO23381.1 hypothetical protein CLAFUR5_12991 [Fulvia fulva]WPV21407.1 hypothetical protein CLAFUW4_13132 [Fulvia fulva]WPV36511.1 hypothetical protein CLAFUW7_13140 [Fulvia fulva]